MSRREINRKFDEIVEFAEIERFLDTPVKRYSSGMYVRLAFGVAAHLNPEILLVDEVLAVGDQKFQKKCLGKMREVARSGRTVLFVSHNTAALESLCDRCILIHQGQVKADGDTGSILARYYEDDQDRASARRDLTEHQRPDPKFEADHVPGHLERRQSKSSLLHPDGILAVDPGGFRRPGTSDSTPSWAW